VKAPAEQGICLVAAASAVRRMGTVRRFDPDGVPANQETEMSMVFLDLLIFRLWTSVKYGQYRPWL